MVRELSRAESKARKKLRRKEGAKKKDRKKKGRGETAGAERMVPGKGPTLRDGESLDGWIGTKRNTCQSVCRLRSLDRAMSPFELPRKTARVQANSRAEMAVLLYVLKVGPSADTYRFTTGGGHCAVLATRVGKEGFEKEVRAIRSKKYRFLAGNQGGLGRQNSCG